MNILPLFILIPVGTAFLLSVMDTAKDDKRLKLLLNWITALTCLVLTVMAGFLIAKSGVFEAGGWVAPIGIVLVLDGFSAPVLLVTNLISLMCVIFSFNYMDMYSKREKFYSLFLLMLAGMNGVVLTGDIFNLYVFMELAAVSSFALVAYGTMKNDLEAAFKYLVLSGVSTTFILMGIALTYGHTRNLNMAFIYEILSETSTPAGMYLAAGFFISGFAIKAALIPFHAWLPDAHPAAPAPVSAMLSGVLIKTAGIYALLRVMFTVFASDMATVGMILRNFGAFSIIAGALLALGQWDFKRLLAYHSISQMGYIALAFGISTPLGIAAGLFHLLNHSVFKSLLFLNAGAVFYRTSTRDLRRMGGLNKVMPVNGYTSMAASLSIAGLPPFSGFWSKLLIIIAAIQAGYLWMAIWAVIGSILTLSSFAKVQKYAFMGEVKEKFLKIKKLSLSMAAPMVFLAFLCLVMGLLLLPGIRETVLERAGDVLLMPYNYLSLIPEAGL